MTQPILSIQIPFTEERENEFRKLCMEFQRQQNEYGLDGLMEVIWDDTGKQMTIGEKRELLYKRSSGIYSVQWDSDDWIKEDGLKRIIEHILGDPDCITYEEYVNIDGREYKSNHSLWYPDWAGDGNKLLEDDFHFQRTPFFKSVIKTEIARIVPIPHIRFGEDHQWAQSLKPHLHSEIHIPQQIYRYIHVSSNPTERYGFDK